ncbi:AfsR/SARP family transcriptional regulator [Nonomuraea sp. NPDC003201]
MSGAGVISIPAPKHRAVLAVLAINFGRPVPADRIIEELWQGSEPKFARKTLQGYIWRLRRVLGEYLITQGGGYELRETPHATDAARFERLLADGQTALRAHDPELAHKRLGAALSLWRGPALVDVPAGPLVQAHANRLEEARLLAVQATLEADVELGRQTVVIPVLRELTAAHPLREPLHALLMLALYRSGRQVEALSVYAGLRATLINELGLEPGRAVQELHRRILAADPALDSAVQWPVTNLQR